VLPSCEDCTVQLGAVQCSALPSAACCAVGVIVIKFNGSFSFYPLFTSFSHSVLFRRSFISSPQFSLPLILPLLRFFISTCVRRLPARPAQHLSHSLAVNPLSIPVLSQCPPGSLPRTRYESFSTLRLSGSFNQILNDSFRAVVPIYCMRI